MCKTSVNTNIIPVNSLGLTVTNSELLGSWADVPAFPEEDSAHLDHDGILRVVVMTSFFCRRGAEVVF